MKITISNDDGEVYTVLTNVEADGFGHFMADDDTGQRNTVDSVIGDAIDWESGDRPAPVAIPCRLGDMRVNNTAGYCEAHGARWVDGDDVCWGVTHYGAARA